MAKRKKEEVERWEVPTIKMTQVIEIPNSDYINTGLNLEELTKYNLNSITIVKGRNTVIEIIKEV